MPGVSGKTSGEGGQTSHYLSMPKQNRELAALPSISSYLKQAPTSKDEITVDFGNMFSASASPADFDQNSSIQSQRKQASPIKN